MKIACDIEEIQPRINFNGFWGLVKGGFQAVFKVKPRIQETRMDPGQYELVIIGTPVWGGRMASPMRTYVNLNKAKFRKVAFFCTCGGSGESAIKDMTETIDLDPASSIVLKSEEVKGDIVKQVDRFIRDLKK
jgi:hypothetical protein